MSNRAERLKHNYAIIKNLTGNTKVASTAKHWGDVKIYKELNIYIPDYPQTVKLRPQSKTYRKRLLKSAENKFFYAIKRGVDPADAEILKFQTYKTIDLQIKYNLFFDYKYKRLSSREKDTRTDAWREWSRADEYPPLMVHNARALNLRLNLDVNASYGFAIYYYSFIQNKKPYDVMKDFPLERSTERIYYGTVEKVR